MNRVLILLTVLLLGIATAQTDLGGRELDVGSDTTYPPFETVTTDGEIVGFDVDVVNAICDVIGCVPTFVTTAWDGIFPALAALVLGAWDLLRRRTRRPEASDGNARRRA